ncbi:MAG: hypothetical protein U1F83_04600 [Verrucomicrobiota bacterium]
MKPNTERDLNSEANTTSTPTHVLPRRPATVLKIATVMLSLAALGLSYQAANQAIALYGVLDKLQDALAQEQLIKAHTTEAARNSETISPVAGL